MEELVYQFWIANLPNIGSKKIEWLLTTFGCPREVFRASASDLERVIGNGALVHGTKFHKKDIATIVNGRDLSLVLKQYNKMLESGVYFVSKDDYRYPEKLKVIYGAPYGLYVKGDLPKKDTKLLAIIGARECSSYGREMASYLSRAIASEGVDIVSGLARGIDTYAHLGALEGGGRTFGILGCGVDICYPRENIELYMEMQGKGGIISEFPMGVQPYASNFPMRNRIISGLCDGILVIEAKEKSGSLITVDMGLDQGKDIYALPGRATDRNSEGCNNLIRMGAKLVLNPSDVLEDFIMNYKQPKKQDKINNNNLLETKSKIVYSCLSLEPKHIEDILEETNIPLDNLMEQLLILEIQGLVKQTRTNYYKLT